MKDFNEIIAQVEERNRRQQQEFINAMQPFFNLTLQKKMKEEELAETEARQRQKNIEFSQQLGQLRAGGSLAADAPAELQLAEFNRWQKQEDVFRQSEEALKLAGQDIYDEYQRRVEGGFDRTVALGVISEKLDAKELRKGIASKYGSKYTAYYDSLIAKGMSPYEASGDTVQKYKRDEEGIAAGAPMSADAAASLEAAKLQGVAETKGLTKDYNDAENAVARYESGKAYSYNDGDKKGTVTIQTKVWKGDKGYASRATYNGVTYEYNSKGIHEWKGGKWVRIEKQSKVPIYQAMKAALADYGVALKARAQAKELWQADLSNKLSAEKNLQQGAAPKNIPGVTWM